MMHRKSNPRNGMYSSGCSDAKTDRPAAEFGQTGPLSEPNGPDNQSGEPALERSNRSSRRQPAGSEDRQIVGNHAQSWRIQAPRRAARTRVPPSARRIDGAAQPAL